MAILPNLNQMTQEQLIAMVQSMQAQPARKLSLKVSEKGAVSLYGLGRFPVTLYGTQWTRLLDASDDIRTFLTVNASRLATKD